MSVLAPLVIVHCGNNGALGPGFVDQVMQIAGPHRNVMFVTPQGSAVMAGSRQRRDRARRRALHNAWIYDWHNIGTGLAPQDAYFYKDGYHLTPVGREYYARNLLQSAAIWHWV